MSFQLGVPSTIPVCYYCGIEKKEITLLGKLRYDKEAPSHAVFNKEPCDRCRQWMKDGFILAEIKNGELKISLPEFGSSDAYSVSLIYLR